MQWVWQQKKWPEFEYDNTKLYEIETAFQRNIGRLIASITHAESSYAQELKIEILTDEGLSTSSIEGEILQRDSVQSSIRKHLGLKHEKKKSDPASAGIAELMVNLYKTYDDRLSHKTLHSWHQMVTNGRRDLENIGTYPTHTEPMQIIAGNYTRPVIYFEAPPSNIIKKEMDRFIKWYHRVLDKKVEIPTLIFAGIVHVYFEMIHPYEDGNGRIGRALVEKAISQRIGMPSLLSWVKIIEQKKKNYYAELQKCNTNLDISDWLLFFAESVIEAQEYSIRMVEFIISKSKFFYRYQSFLNPRQEKVILRIFEAGIEGFKGGLSADNYKTIAQTSPATTTRDLQELVALNVLTKSGILKHTRYYLNLEDL